VWIDGSLVIDAWTDHAPREDSGTAALQAGVLHDVVIEYYDSGDYAVAQLLWESASQIKQIVPTGRLYPPAPPNAPPYAVDDLSGTLTLYPVPIEVLANDLDDQGELDPTTVVATDGISGTTSVDPVTGVVTYTPDGVTTGSDAFYYSVADLDGAISTLENLLRRHPDDGTLAALLDLPDNDLWDIVSGRSDCFDGSLRGIVARLRAS